jgi:hypothetical protein
VPPCCLSSFSARSREAASSKPVTRKRMRAKAPAPARCCGACAAAAGSERRRGAGAAGRAGGAAGADGRDALLLAACCCLHATALYPSCAAVHVESPCSFACGCQKPQSSSSCAAMPRANLQGKDGESHALEKRNLCLSYLCGGAAACAGLGAAAAALLRHLVQPPRAKRQREQPSLGFCPGGDCPAAAGCATSPIASLGSPSCPASPPLLPCKRQLRPSMRLRMPKQ